MTAAPAFAFTQWRAYRPRGLAFSMVFSAVLLAIFGAPAVQAQSAIPEAQRQIVAQSETERNDKVAPKDADSAFAAKQGAAPLSTEPQEKPVAAPPRAMPSGDGWPIWAKGAVLLMLAASLLGNLILALRLKQARQSLAWAALAPSDADAETVQVDSKPIGDDMPGAKHLNRARAEANSASAPTRTRYGDEGFGRAPAAHHPIDAEPARIVGGAQAWEHPLPADDGGADSISDAPPVPHEAPPQDQQPESSAPPSMVPANAVAAADLALIQQLVAQAPRMVMAEFRPAMAALGEWYPIAVEGNTATLFTGADDGVPRPLVAVLRDDGRKAIVLPSLHFAREFGMKYSKLRNSEAIRPFFDRQCTGASTLTYDEPCVVALSGAEIDQIHAGVLGGFSD